jgi:hypothetical protein
LGQGFGCTSRVCELQPCRRAGYLNLCTRFKSGLFSAVLSAFLVEIRKGIQVDPQDTMNDRLLDILNRMANTTSIPVSIPTSAPFSPPRLLVAVTSIWFASLILSLVASLGSILAKPWIMDYGAWMTAAPTLPRYDAEQRHRRYIGTRKWRLGAVIPTVPILIHLALFLFFVGLGVFLWIDNKTVAIVVIVLLSVTFALYFVATILPLVARDCPISTPLSRPLRDLPYRLTRISIWGFIWYCTALSAGIAGLLGRWMSFYTIHRPAWQARFPEGGDFTWT